MGKTHVCYDSRGVPNPHSETGQSTLTPVLEPLRVVRTSSGSNKCHLRKRVLVPRTGCDLFPVLMKTLGVSLPGTQCAIDL